MKNDFFRYQAQTSEHPLALQIARAEGCYLYDQNGNGYLDFIAGVSANTLGHGHKKVVEAIKDQAERYMHVMVYGEFVQEPQVSLCRFLAEHLPENLNCTYLTNSGTEATEGALKLAKRVTGRYEIIAARNAYHGNTQGSMSVCGREEQNRAFRPLIPGARFIHFNAEEDLESITTKTAAVILETIQGGAGFIVPHPSYLQKVKQRCEQVGALLILDEIQSGIGRTGSLFGFEQFAVVPDIVITGKGLGGGMPIGAFISSREYMGKLSTNPKLGHITTFGGHPVIAAAALATLNELYDTSVMQQVVAKEKLFRSLLTHELILEIRGKGLMLAMMLETAEMASALIHSAMEEGLLLFWLLFEPRAVRITPPLTISEEEIRKGCAVILNILDRLSRQQLT